MIDENKIISSMSKLGCPYDNSCIESFCNILKRNIFTEKVMLQLKK